eukprot:3618106-Amphidinium_carterae.1
MFWTHTQTQVVVVEKSCKPKGKCGTCRQSLWSAVLAATQSSNSLCEEGRSWMCSRLRVCVSDSVYNVCIGHAYMTEREEVMGLLFGDKKDRGLSVHEH